MDSLNETGKVTVVVEGVEEELATVDLLIEAAQKEGYVSDSDHGITVVLDTNLTDALIEEGFVRELISKVQTMRKDSDFEVMDHIIVYVNGNAKLEELMKKNEAEIKSVVLADEVVTGAMEGIAKEWNLTGEDVTIGVKRL